MPLPLGKVLINCCVIAGAVWHFWKFWKKWEISWKPRKVSIPELLTSNIAFYVQDQRTRNFNLKNLKKNSTRLEFLSNFTILICTRYTRTNIWSHKSPIQFHIPTPNPNFIQVRLISATAKGKQKQFHSSLNVLWFQSVNTFATVHL